MENGRALTLLVAHEGREVFRKQFDQEVVAVDWFWWRVRAMQAGTARYPGDTVMLVNQDGVVLESRTRRAASS